jgi:hypothetical protein
MLHTLAKAGCVTWTRVTTRIDCSMLFVASLPVQQFACRVDDGTFLVLCLRFWHGVWHRLVAFLPLLSE